MGIRVQTMEDGRSRDSARLYVVRNRTPIPPDTR